MLNQLLLDDQPVSTQNNHYTIDSVTSNHSLKAIFKRVYHITSISGAGGKIEPEGRILADEHSSLTFAIMPDSSYELAKLTSEGIEMNIMNNIFTLNDIDQDQTLMASFKLKQLRIISQSGDNGTIIPEGHFMVDAGSEKTFFIQPSVGCQIKTLRVNDEVVLLSGNQYRLENITDDYTIQAEFEVINNAPVSDDQHLSLLEDTKLNGILIAKDLDKETLTFSIQRNTAFGMLVLSDTNLFTYTPDSNYFGSDSFTFIANDGKSDSNLAVVSLHITPVNDPPESYDCEIQLDEDSFTTGLLTAHDIDNDPLTFTITSQATKGFAEISNKHTGAFIYTPLPDAYGKDQFSFTVSDNDLSSQPSVVDISIQAINDLPQSKDQILETLGIQSTDITLFGMDKDNDSLSYYLKTLPLNGQIFCMGNAIDQLSDSLESAHIVYIPDEDFRGLDTFSYYVNDGFANSQVSEIQIQVGGFNIQTREDTPIGLTDMLSLTITITHPPLHGTLTVNEDIIYTPAANYSGYDNFK